MKLSDYRPEARFFGLLVGESGSGKSCASASFPAPHICDFDGRIAGVHNYRSHFTGEIMWDYFAPKKKGWADIDRYLELLGTQIAIRQNTTDTEILQSMGSLCKFLLAESIELQGGQLVGKVGTEEKYKLRVPGPNDYKYEVTALQQVMDYLKSLQVNIVCECHVEDKYGKRGEDKIGEMSPADFAAWQKLIVPTTIIGEKLNLRPGIEQYVLGQFNEVYRFRKEESEKGDKFYVKFKGDIARTCLPLPAGEHDITNKNFYNYWKEALGKEN